MVGGIRGILIHERPILPENNFPFQEERWEGVVLPCLYKHFEERESIMDISEYKVMKSPAGYYVGKEYYDQEMIGWFPYSRNSEYFKSHKEAKKLLKKINEN